MHIQDQQWTEKELDDNIVKLFLEFPEAPLRAYARAQAFCRHNVPNGSIASLLEAMRRCLRAETAGNVRTA